MEPCNKPPKGLHVTGSGFLDVCPRHGVKHYASTPKPQRVPNKVWRALNELEGAVWDETGNLIRGQLVVTTEDGTKHTINLPWYS